MTTTQRTILMLSAMLMPAFAFAHAGPAADHGMLAGLVHPFGGADHFAAMLAVGMWTALTARHGRLDLVLPPIGFVALLATGAALGAGGAAASAVEPMIAASLLVFGLLLAWQVRLPMAAALVLVGSFGFFHGAAHGRGLGGAAALVGMVLGTATLHGAGIAFGLLMRHRGARWARAAGLALALAGGTLGLLLAGGAAA
jgi:urease accessory protein